MSYFRVCILNTQQTVPNFSIFIQFPKKNFIAKNGLSIYMQDKWLFI